MNPMDGNRRDQSLFGPRLVKPALRHPHLQSTFGKTWRPAMEFKTAKSLGLVVPPSIQQRADEVIEE